MNIACPACAELVEATFSSAKATRIVVEAEPSAFFATVTVLVPHRCAA